MKRRINLDRYARLFPRPLIRALRTGWLFILDLRDRLQGHSRLLPPRSLHYVGAGDFTTIGRHFVGHFKSVCGLKPWEAVLDIGCGTGRMAIPLLEYLAPPGRYIGFDINKKAIRWCREHITSRNGGFIFYCADICNREYNPRGRVSALDYRFPCEDESIDFAFAASVFTHLRGTEVKHYLSEIHRVLKPSGRCMLNFFLLDETARTLMAEGRASQYFSVALPDCFTIDEKTPERATAFTVDQLMGLLSDSGLELSMPIHYGGWSGRPAQLDSQDIVCLTKSR